MLKLPLMLIALMTADHIYAQTPSEQKIGHADWEYIFSHLPEFKAIELVCNLVKDSSEHAELVDLNAIAQNGIR